ncbi:MAG: TIGR02147 family protein [Bdellovibrio sp.]|nr:TIGR02147 family protein [Bdellovibrio sp.]
MNTPRPNIKNYLNINDFLTDVYTYKKQIDPEFSYATWAQELGLTNKSFLRQIIVGRRNLTTETIPLFCENLELDNSEKEYFQLLSLYSRARTAEQRDLYGRRLRQLIHMDYPQKQILDPAKLTLKTIYPRLLTILGFSDIQKTPLKLALLLNVSLEDTLEALEVLRSLQLAESSLIDEQIHWHALTKSFRVPDNLGNDVLLAYHKQSLLEAIHAGQLPKSDRRYRSLLLALKEENFEQFLGDLENFVKQVFSKYNSDAFAERRLFQINFNIHAVSDFFKEDPAPKSLEESL